MGFLVRYACSRQLYRIFRHKNAANIFVLGFFVSITIFVGHSRPNFYFNLNASHHFQKPIFLNFAPIRFLFQKSIFLCFTPILFLAVFIFLKTARLYSSIQNCRRCTPSSVALCYQFPAKLITRLITKLITRRSGTSPQKIIEKDLTSSA